MSSLDPAITNGLVQCGTNGVSNSCMSNKLFYSAPRVGFYWDPFKDGKTAVRAGYGSFWEHGTGFEANVGSLIGSAPLVLSETQSNFGGYGNIGFSGQGGAAQYRGATLPGASPTAGATFPLNVTSIPTNAIYPYVQQWSLSVQREVRKAMVAQFAYVGTKGTHLTVVRDVNQRSAMPSIHLDRGSHYDQRLPEWSGGGPFMVAGVNAGGPQLGVTVPIALESVQMTLAIPICSLLARVALVSAIRI